MNKNTDRTVDKTLKKLIDDETIKPEERRLLMQYMEEMEKTSSENLPCGRENSMFK